MNNKYIMTFLATAFITASMISCNSADLLPEIPDLSFSIIGRDTIRTNIFSPQLLENAKDNIGIYSNSISYETKVILAREIKLPESNLPESDLTELRNSKYTDGEQNEFKYVAIGSSLTAGVRDGGYFNEGILTSFPAILANHFKIKNFDQPLFSPSDYNGYGRNERVSSNWTGGPVLKFARSSNNLGFIASEKTIDSKPLNRAFESFNNLGVLRSGAFGLDFPRAASSVKETFETNRFDNWGFGKGENGIFGLTPLANKYRALNGDFFTLEYMSEFLDFALGSGNVQVGPGIHSPSTPSVLSILTNYSEKGLKGCVLNTPDVTKFQVLHQIKDFTFYCSVLKSIDPSFSLTPEQFKREEYLIHPTTGNDSLASPKIHIALKSSSQVNISEKKDIQRLIGELNDRMKEYAEKAGYPLVDIYGLYNKILEGSFVSHDGVKVDPSLNNGNFFSSDGAYPSAFGNAIISNEIIRTLNRHYKTNIDLISTKAYLQIK